MTYYSKQSEKPSIGTFYGFHHLRFYVSNAKQAASFYTSRFGFHPIAYEGLETGNSSQCTRVVKSNDIVFAFSSSLKPQDSSIASHVLVHSDGVKDIAFSVDDARGIYAKATSRGAKGVRAPEILQDSYGSILIASLQTYGDTVHTLIQNIDYTGPFLPGFILTTNDDPLNNLFPKIDLELIDHVVGNQQSGDMAPTAEWYERNLDFHRYWSVDDSIIPLKVYCFLLAVIWPKRWAVG